MKNGKVLAKLAQDKRVAKLELASDNEQVTVTLADDYYVVKGPRRAAFTTAKALNAFIKSAQKMPVAREGYEIVTNLMTGLPVEQKVGTPRSCDVSSELYWSM